MVQLDGPLAQYMQTYIQTVSVVLGHRCLFMTEKGYLGIGLGTMAEGNEVFLPIGAQTPFILHPLPSKPGSESDNDGLRASHVFVGECYLHGWVDGEALDEKNGCVYSNVILR